MSDCHPVLLPEGPFSREQAMAVTTAYRKPATGTVSIMLTATGMKTCMKTSGRSVTFSGLTSASAFSGSATAGLWKSRASGSADSAARGTEPVLKDAGTGSQQQPGGSGSMPHRTMNSIVSRMPCRRCRNVTSGNCRLKSTTGDVTAIRTAWISLLPGTVRLVRL